MDEKLPSGVHSFRPVDDPLANWPKDVPLSIRLVEPGWASASTAPKKVANWDYYDGAIVMIGVSDGETYTIEGSGVVVAPGLVLSATHVLRHHADAIAARTLGVYCIGVRPEGRADLWAVTKSLRYAEDHSDIMFLGVELNSEISDDWHVSCLPISTRAPQEGESLTIVGYRFDRPEAEPLPSSTAFAPSDAATSTSLPARSRQGPPRRTDGDRLHGLVAANGTAHSGQEISLVALIHLHV